MSSCAPGSDTYCAPKDQIISGARLAFWRQFLDVTNKVCCTFANYSTLGSLHNIPRTTKKRIWLYIGRAKSARTSNRERSPSVTHCLLVTSKYGNCAAFYPEL